MEIMLLKHDIHDKAKKIMVFTQEISHSFSGKQEIDNKERGGKPHVIDTFSQSVVYSICILLQHTFAKLHDLKEFKT